MIIFFFFNDTATTEIYTLSLHDALPISSGSSSSTRTMRCIANRLSNRTSTTTGPRSEEHTSELQSPCNLVCRLLLEKKKKDHQNVPPQFMGPHVTGALPHHCQSVTHQII